MASLISHAVAALGIGTVFAQARLPKGVWIAGVACSVLPDIDVIGFRCGIRYGDFWGHRGFTHSLLFAVMLASALSFSGLVRQITATNRIFLWVYLFVATASHGVLDAMTNGGLGVAFFSPFDNTRYFLPWRPIEVSPISLRRFFSESGLMVLRSEIVWIWIPAAILAALVLVFAAFLRRSRGIERV